MLPDSLANSDQNNASARKRTANGAAQFSVVIKNQTPPNRQLNKPQYVSSATHSIRLQVATVNGIAPTKQIAENVALTPANKRDCKVSGKALSCTLRIVVPSGKVAFDASLFESLDASGSPLSTAAVIAKIKPHRTTEVRMVPDGVPATIVPSVTAIGAVSDGGTHKVTFTVSALDASGATIIGPGKYATPLQVTTTGGGALHATPYEITSPRTGNSTVTVKYDSAYALTSGAITILSGSLTPATVAFVPMTVSPAALNGFLLGDPGQTQTISISEANQTGGYVLGGTSGALSITCTPSTCAPASAGAIVQVSLAPQAAGSGTLTIADGLGTTASFAYRVSSLTNYNNVASGGAVSNVIVGPDGNLWTVLQSGGSGQIARVTTGGAVTTYPLPSPFNPTNSPDGIAGSDQAIWLVDGSTSYVYRVSTSTASLGTVTAYPTAKSAVPTSIVLGSDQQTLYYTDTHGNVGSINESTQATAAFTDPFSGGSAANSIVADSGGTLYFVANARAIKMTTAGTFAQLPPLKVNSYEYVYPNVLTIGPDGKLWEGTPYGYLCTQTTSGTTSTCYANALTQTISSVAVGPDGAIWASGATSTPVNAFTRTTTAGVTTTYVPYDCCAVEHGIAIGSDGALWIASSGGGLDRIVP
jgi:virginiamycin B lyase